MALPQKVPIGQPFAEFSAGSFNALVDWHWVDKARVDRPPSGLAPRGGPSLKIQVLNDTSQDIGPGEIFGYSEPIFKLEDNPEEMLAVPTVKGIAPDATIHARRFAVALDFIPQNTVGPCAIVGLAPVKVHWTSESHTQGVVESGSHQLQSTDGGLPLLLLQEIPDAEYLPADVWALVLLGGGGGNGGDVTIALIDDDIPGITEVEEFAEQENADPEGDPLLLYDVAPRAVDLKYYRLATENDPGYEEGMPKYILATKEQEIDESTNETVYDTRTFYYLDAKAFAVGEYNRSDYPEYDENSEFPPPGLPEGFLKRRYRAQAKPDAAGNWWLDLSTCKPVKAPPLPLET